MKKSVQREINNIVMAGIEQCNNEHEAIISAHRLRYCSATVLETENWYILRSYNTDIAMIDKRTGIMYDFLRWVYGFTSTSSQHCAKFEHDYNARARFTYYTV